MRIILFILIMQSLLFSVIINNKYSISRISLSSLIDGNKIYSYIEKKPKIYKGLKKKSFFSLSDFDDINSYTKSSYSKFYIFNTYNENYIYIKVPSSLLKNEFNIKKKFYILRFKKEFIKDKLTYLSLDIGEKREFTFFFKSYDIIDFVKNHSNLLFDKKDLFDSVKIDSDKIIFTTNYRKKDFEINFYLKKFIKMHKNTIISKNIEKSFLLKINNELPPLRCDNKNLLPSIFIDDDEFTLEEETSTNNLYALYLLNDEHKFNQFLKKNIKSVHIKSKLQNNIHTLSYTSTYKDIKININLPKDISYDIKAKFISSFNSFKFKINGTTFNGYLDGKSKYQIQKDICNSNKNIEIINTKNYSAFKKWDIKINNDKNSITWTPKFSISKISTAIHTPFLIKNKNKYVIKSIIDEEGNMEGEIKYSYIYNGVIFQNKSIINPKTNTNFYFEYPKNSIIDDVFKTTKFIYNSNIIKVTKNTNNNIKDRIMFSAKSANKVALIYYPAGNINSFRKYFLRYFECNNLIIKDDDETCYEYLASMGDGMENFISNLRKKNAYANIIYRKTTFNEKAKKNLSIITRNVKYEYAKDGEVLGKNYANYKWHLSDSLRYDKDILNNYGLKNIDLIYFSNINSQDKATLSKLNDFGFNKVFLVNFGNDMGNSLSDYENIKLIKHKYSHKMIEQIQEFDAQVFDVILNQIMKGASINAK